MNIDQLTIGEAKQLATLFSQQSGSSSHFFTIGKNYFIRTVTHHYTGVLVAVGDKELVLEKAAWIADDGRLTDALKECEFNEVEMYPADSQVIIGRAALLDAVQISKIPISQK